MAPNELQEIVRELIDLMRLETREVEKLVVHLEQFAGKLPEEHQFSSLTAQLTALRTRLKG